MAPHLYYGIAVTSTCFQMILGMMDIGRNY